MPYGRSVSDHLTTSVGAFRFVQREGRLAVQSPNGRKTELPGTEMTVQGDRVTLHGESQILTFRRDGGGATVQDLTDKEEPTYRLQADGRFSFEVAGFDGYAYPTAEGTLATPVREVAPLAPIESFLPGVNKSSERTPRTNLLVRGLKTATQHPFLSGIGVGIGTGIWGDAIVGCILGGATFAALSLVNMASSRLAHKGSEVRLGPGGAVAAGKLGIKVNRGRTPGPGRARASNFQLSSVELKLNNGIELKQHRKGRLQMSGVGREESYKKHDIDLNEGQTFVVSRGESGYSAHYKILPNGKLESPDYPRYPEFSETYEALSQLSPSVDGMGLEFEENEVLVEEFSLPYEH